MYIETRQISNVGSQDVTKEILLTAQKSDEEIPSRFLSYQNFSLIMVVDGKYGERVKGRDLVIYHYTILSMQL